MATRIAFLAMAMLALNGASPPENRPLFTVKEFPAFHVMVPQEKAAWCGETARVTIEGQTAEQFSQNQPVIERIVGGLRAVLSFECPQATTIMLSGKVADQPLYEASASASGGWKLEGVTLRTADQLRMMADLETIGRCDALGAGKDDPEAMADGVADGRLDASAVVPACRKAMALDPEAPRFKYQLARGLLKQGDVEEAVEQLVAAGEAGHGGSLALLGDIYLNGSGSVEADPATAKALYERAVEAGYEPAKTVLAGFEDQTKAVALADAEEKAEMARLAAEDRKLAAVPAHRAGNALNTQGYEYPDIVASVYSGDFENLSERGTKIYLVNMASAFSNVCRGSFSIREMNDLSLSVIDKSDLTPQAGLNRLYDLAAMMAGIAQNPGSMMDVARNAQAADSIPQQASNDAMLFVQRNNCGSAAFTKFTQNLRSYVTDQSIAINLAAPEYHQACMAGARPTHYSVPDFCGCFVARAESVGLTRAEKKGLLTSFWPTATSIMDRNAQHFGACNGAFAR